MDTSGFDIQFDNHIPENGYRIEGYLCNANKSVKWWIFDDLRRS